MDLTIFLHVIIESAFALFCIMAAIYIRLYDAVSKKVTAVMTAGLLMSAIINIADAAAYLYRGGSTETAYYAVRISNFIVFAGMFALIAFGSMLLDSVIEMRGGRKAARLHKAVIAICFAGWALIILSRFFGFIYRFDDGNTYHRAEGYAVLPVLAVAALCLLLKRVSDERESLPLREYIAFRCLFMLPVLGALFQTVYYGISLANLANSIALLIMLAVFLREAVSEINIRKSLILTGESIDAVSEEVEDFLRQTGTEKQNRIRIRFTVEDALVRIWEHFGDLTMVKVTAGFSFGRPYLRIMHEGEAFNPFSKTKGAYDEWLGGLLPAAGLSPDYSYSHGFNNIRITLGRRQINPVVTILITIVFGLVIGNVALFALSDTDRMFVTQSILVPVYDLWNNILFSVAAPAMFVIVMSTMLDAREIDEQGGDARRIIGRYFTSMLLMGVITLASAGLLDADAFVSEPMTRDKIAELIRALFSVIPENLMEPFRDFNTAQLILMGIIFAYATMAVGRQADGIASLIRQLNLLSTQLAQWIAQLMPLFTVFLIARLVLEDNAGLLLGILVIIPFALVVSLAVMLLYFLYVGRRMDVGPDVLIRKLWPSFALTLRTGQVSESYALAERCCHADLGIQKIFTQRGMPLGLVLYMPASMAGMMAFVIYAAVRSGILITPLWMLTAIVFALILLVAAPPIPGVNLLSYIVIMGQLGIDNNYIIAAMIFDIIFNMFASAANQSMLQLDLVLQADRVGLLNKETLRADIK
jgi:Na+/H+-dicarboxylate symporter